MLFSKKNSSEQVPKLVNKKVNVMFYLFTRIKLNKNWLKEIKFIYFLYIYHLLISLSNFFSTSIICFNFCRFRHEISKNIC